MHDERRLVNDDVLKGRWREFKGMVKEQWGKLTDDELDEIEGKSDQLAGKLQARYGYTREQADREIRDFVGVKEPLVNEEILSGRWRQLKGMVKEQWGKLTDDELDEIEGKSDQLAGKLQARYGYTREYANEQIRDFLRKV